MFRFKSPGFGSDGNSTDDAYPTATSREQAKVEDRIQQLTDKHLQERGPNIIPDFLRDAHISYLFRSFEHLPQGYTSLDASRTWLVYWLMHSLRLMSVPIPDSLARRCLTFLSKCQDRVMGGFGGGPGQQPHVAPTFAAVNAICIIANSQPHLKDCLQLINREKLYNFLLSIHNDEFGYFAVAPDGEYDTRASYCALSVAKITNLLSPALTHKTASFLVSCQSYEGGIGGENGNEAHGGYTFCALASLLLLEDVAALRELNLSGLAYWANQRQMVNEGGFQGRTNKLVDGCYSFWVGSLDRLIHWADYALEHNVFPFSTSLNSIPNLISSSFGEESTTISKDATISSLSLLRYLLLACQCESGGLRDKPGKPPDIYHTCYCLSGMSLGMEAINLAAVSQASTAAHTENDENDKKQEENTESGESAECFNIEEEADEQDSGKTGRDGQAAGREKMTTSSWSLRNNWAESVSNAQIATGIHPVFNLLYADVIPAMEYFSQLSQIQTRKKN